MCDIIPKLVSLSKGYKRICVVFIYMYTHTHTYVCYTRDGNLSANRLSDGRHTHTHARSTMSAGRSPVGYFFFHNHRIPLLIVIIGSLVSGRECVQQSRGRRKNNNNNMNMNTNIKGCACFAFLIIANQCARAVLYAFIGLHIQ